MTVHLIDLNIKYCITPSDLKSIRSGNTGQG